MSPNRSSTTRAPSAPAAPEPAHARAITALLLAAATAGRIDPRLDHAVFATVVGGVTVFVLGLLADATVVKRIGAPTMGTGLLVGSAVFAVALLRGRRSGSPA